jgi:hypothetical protein
MIAMWNNDFMKASRNLGMERLPPSGLQDAGDKQ